jgi:cytochrome bd ubiquinol oxidase subunit II
MTGLEYVLGVVMMAALTIYALLGGADYGGGVWDMLAGGPRAKQQRELIADAIGPIWEANHVWLILVVVVMFSAFPPAFALITTALHIPIALMLVGIVLRGSAFTFRAYDSKEDRVQRRWGTMFAVPSLVTPVLLGVLVGAVSSGAVRKQTNGVTWSYFLVWVGPFEFAVGLFAVVLFAFLAAVYLTVEARDAELRDDFRARAIGAEVVAGVLALVVFVLAGAGAPEIRERLARSWWTWPLQIATAGMAVATLWALWRRRFGVARVTAAGQVTLILWGWGLAQYPYLVRPDLTLANSAAPEATLRMMVWALGLGTLLLGPSYWYLFRVFKGRLVGGEGK